MYLSDDIKTSDINSCSLAPATYSLLFELSWSMPFQMLLRIATAVHLLNKGIPYPVVSLASFLNSRSNQKRNYHNN